jgi:hypothetical protein
MNIGIDGALVKGRRPTDRASLEIITGRFEADAEESKVFAVVRDQDVLRGCPPHGGHVADEFVGHFTVTAFVDCHRCVAAERGTTTVVHLPMNI